MDESRRAASPVMAGSRCASPQVLPKSSPYVGHYRHAPPSPVPSELAERLQKLLSRNRKTQDTKDAPRPLALLPKSSPFVGTQRHAPQSPTGAMSPITLEPVAFPTDGAFFDNDDGPLGLFFLDDSMMDPDDVEDEDETFCLRPILDDHEEEFMLEPFPTLGLKKKSAPILNTMKNSTMKKKSAICGDTYLPHTTLCQVLNNVATAKMLGSLICVSHTFEEAVRSPQTWQGLVISLPPEILNYSATIEKQVAMWSEAKKIVIPRCSSLFLELSHTCPEVLVENAWRFDQRLKGSGVTVKNYGKTACRTDSDKVVVLGDAPVRKRYFEIILDERDDDMGWENPNDFGLGVTSSQRKAREQMKSVEVAGEIPHSWVVDFSKSSIFLVINNEQAAQYDLFGAQDIRKGDRVGLLLEPHWIRVYVNGIQEASLKVPDHAPIEEGILYPVFDLYGRTKQMTYTMASGPVEDKKRQ